MGIKSFGLKHALLMGAAAFGLSVSTALPSPAYAQEATRSYDIPAQDLDDALREFGRQTGRDVLFTPDAVAGKRSGALVGQMTERQAIDAILAGSGLRFEQTASGGYAVQDPSSPTRLGDANGAAPSDDGATAEILVVGRRTLNADIRRTEDDTQPYVVFSSEDIERAGATNVEDFLRTRLPMNTQQGGTLQNAGQAAVNMGSEGGISLRGLNARETLILVDGRRLPGVANGNEFAQPNINGIPPSAIERIEVLPSTAGGIYGGSATGGVINIVLRRDYRGVDIEGTYGSSFDGAAARTDLSLFGGASFNDGRTDVTFSITRREQDELTDRDRNVSQRTTDLALRNDPSESRGFTAFGSSPNIVSADGTELTLDATYGGGALGSTITFAPEGYLGPSTDNAAALAANAGHLNTSGLPTTLLEGPTVESQSISVRQEFTSWLDGYLDVRHDESVDVGTELRFYQVFLGADATNNPFQQDILVNLGLGTNGLAPSISAIESTSAGTGLLADLPFSWRGSLEYGWGRSSLSPFYQFYTEPTDFTALEAGALVDDPNRESLFMRGFTRYPTESEIQTTTVRASGPLAQLPAGSITLSALVERREENANAIVQSNSFGDSENYIYSPPGERTATSAYVEAVVPVFSEAHGSPFLRELDFTAAVRWEEVSVSYGPSQFISDPNGPFPTTPLQSNEFESSNFSLGARYSPLSDLTLRASFGTGFLPPTLTRVVSRTEIRSASSFPSSTRDPLRGNQQLIGNSAGLVTVLSGGGDYLLPEQSESLSYGLIFTPGWLEGFRLSLDYTQIEKTDEINGVSNLFIIQNEALFPGRVTRGPNLPSDPVGWAGPIIGLDARVMNIAHTEIAALDIQADYTFQIENLGDFRLYLVATHQSELTRQNLPTSPAVDSAGHEGGPLFWRGNFGLDWQREEWRAGWNAQYFDEYNLCPPSGGDCSFITDQQGSETVPSQIYHDLFVSYEPREGTMLSLSVHNLFDEEPPLIVGGSNYSLFGDPRLRRFAVTLRQHF